MSFRNENSCWYCTLIWSTIFIGISTFWFLFFMNLNSLKTFTISFEKYQEFGL